MFHEMISVGTAMKKFALLIIACLEAFNIAVAQITSQQADALVTNQIYDTIIEYVDIFILLPRNSIKVCGLSMLRRYTDAWLLE